MSLSRPPLTHFLNWRQVNAWRLSQHDLSMRLPPRELITAVRRTGGVQAQVMSAAEQAIWARTDGILPQDVQSALWQERTLVKTWAMRAALHLLPASDLPLYVAARSLDEPLNWIRYFDYFGITKSQYEAYLAAAPEILGSQPLTRQQLATALARRIGLPGLRDLMISKGWGTPLKPLAWRGDLCFGPNEGRNVTFVNPRMWLDGWRPLDPYPALQEIARRYLRAYGPATVEQFARWWGMRLTPARKLFQSLQAELEPVEIEGWPAIALQETLEPMERAELTGTVNLLPLFDAYLMGIGRGADIETLLPKACQPLVYRPQGWVSAVVLFDGYIRGTWEMKAGRSEIGLVIRMFSPPTPAILAGLETEAERLGVFLKRKISLTFADK